MDDGGGQFYQILYTVVEFVSQVVYVFILFVLVRALEWAAFSACEPQTQTPSAVSQVYARRLPFRGPFMFHARILRVQHSEGKLADQSFGPA